MARQFWFRPMSAEAQSNGGWSDAFNRLFSDLGLRFNVADRIAAQAAFELIPTPGATLTPMPVLPAFPLSPTSDSRVSFGLAAGQPGAAVAVMGGAPQGSFGRGGASGPAPLGYAILYSDDLSPGLIIDLASR